MVLRPNIVLKACALIVLACVWGKHALLAATAPAPANSDMRGTVRVGAKGSVTGVVFLDRNGNGLRERDEPGFSGIAVTLFGKKIDGSPFYLATRTDAGGRFAFAGELIGDGSTFTVSTGGMPLAATVPTVYHPARTYYAAVAGDDANPGSLERPFRTIGHAVPLLAAGDLLYVRQGEYRECISSTSRPLGGGTGWDCPIVVAGMPGETVVIRPADRIVSDPLVNLTSQRQQYLVFDNLVFDGEGTAVPLKAQAGDAKEPPPHHVRVINCELKNARGPGVFLSGDGYQIINCRIHDNGHAETDHGVHVNGGHNLIQGCDIYYNAGWGILLDGGPGKLASNNVIRGNRIHDNDLSQKGGAGIGLYYGSKNLVYDNVIWANTFGIAINSQGCEQQIFNNTVYHNRLPGIAIGTDVETHGNVVRNNIAIANGDPNLHKGSANNVVDHNLISGNPLFRDPKANDFHLQPGSPAIDAGVTIAEVRSDHDGVSRPQGKEYDQGAYEYSDNSFVPTTSTYSNIFAAGQAYPVLIGFTTKAK